MTRRAARLVLPACVALALALVRAAHAADGVPVMPFFHGAQDRPGLAPDGSGGAWVAFKSGSGSVGIAHLGPNGLAIPDASLAIHPVALALDAGKACVVVSDALDRVFVAADLPADDAILVGWDGAGAPLPEPPPVTAGYYRFPGMLRTTDGRVLVAGSVSLGSSQTGTRFAFVSADGGLESESSVATGYQQAEADGQIVTDAAGGGILAAPMYFSPDYSTGSDVAIQRIAADGSRPWGSNGKIVCTVNGYQTDIRLAPDGAGGVLLTWTDPRTSPAADPYDVYASRYTAAGTLVSGWGTSGIGRRVTTSAGGQFESRVVADGAGGAWILWRDQRVPDIDLYYTHLLANGAYASGFSGLGTLLCGAAGDAADPRMVPDGSGGFFAAWIDPRNGNSDVFAQHVTAGGTIDPGWPANGLALCDDPSFQTQVQIVATGPGAAMVVWRDSRGTAGEVRAVALGASGPVTAGVPGAADIAFALRSSDNPGAGEPCVRLTAPAGARVTLELLDVGGRVVRRSEAAGTGGATRVRFGGAPLAAGVYFARASLGARSLSTRVCVLR